MDHLLNTQLNKLQTDNIDYYLLHGIDGNSWNTIKNVGVREFLDNAKKDGRITNAGFSFHGDKNDFKEIVDAYDWEFCQIQYNFLDEQNQAGTEGLEYAVAKGLGLIIMEPLRGGNLAGKIPPEVEAIWNEAEVKRTPAEWALRWVWNRPEVTVVLSGMNEEAHIEENLRIASKAFPNSLTEQDLHLVSRVTETYRKLMKTGCTGCRYCMPCPAGVNIPACFEHYNSYHMFDNKQYRKMLYLIQNGGFLGKKPELASLCTQCGKCVNACPQHLPIPELLQDVKKDMQGPMTQPLIWILKRVFAIHNWNTLRKARRLEKR
jgi:predicted aldo/keto reductase-like oxidoreductase